MKIGKQQLQLLIEEVLSENEDPFAEQLRVCDQRISSFLSELKKEVFAAKQIAEKAKRYGTASGNKLSNYDKILDAVYEFIRKDKQ